MAPSATSLHVRGQIGKLCCTWLVDTGAMVTCVSAALPGIKSLTWAPTKQRPVGANGLSLNCVGEVTADISIGPAILNNVRILVVENLSAPAILGTDVLRTFSRFSVDFERRQLYIGGFCLDLEARQNGTPGQPVAAKLTSDCVLDPHSECIVHVGAVDFGASARQVVFDPGVSTPSRLGVSVSPCVARLGVDNKIPVLITNPGGQPVRLFANMVLGEVSDGEVASQATSRVPHREGPVRVDLTGAEVGEAERETLKRLFNAYRDVFANSDDELGQTQLIQFRINTGGSQPVAVRTRRTPYHLRPEVSRQIEMMEKRGIIQKSNSPWSAPIIMVKKADGSYRFAVDFRELNRKTVDEVVYLPSVKECLDSLAGSQVFTTLDLNSAYWQVPVAADDRKKTAFCTEEDKWEFLVMPFGAKGAPGCFTRLMSEVLRGLLGNGVTAYLDDIIVGGKTVPEHCALLQSVFERLRRAGLTVKSAKVVPCRRRIRFLGHLVSSSGLEPDPQKVEVIRKWPRPETTKEVRQFLGMCNYYNDFMPHLQVWATPLNALTGKSKFCWGAEQDAAFGKLKEALGSTAILQLPDMQKTFEVSTDASDVGLGCILSQRDDHGRDRPVCFASRAFSDSERNWHIRDKEVFAFIFALRKFRPYLLGKRFDWFTDHCGLQWLRNTRDPRGRYARWIEEIEEFEFTTHFRRAEDNQHADALSRAHVRTTHVTTDGATGDDLREDELLAAQQEDEVLKNLYEETRLSKMNGKAAKQWRLRGFEPTVDKGSGLLMGRKGKETFVLVPSKYVGRLLRLKHDRAGHFGPAKTCALLRQSGYIWMGMEQDAKHYCSSCVVCARANDPRQKWRAPLVETSRPGAPWHDVSVDLMGPFGRTATERGNRYVLVALDLFTKSVELAAIPNKSAETVARALCDIVICRHGIPESLLTDRGLEFDNQHMTMLADALGIDKKRISAFHPQANGAVERVNQTLGSLLRRNAQEFEGSWDTQLGLVRFQYMSVPHSVTGLSPFFLTYGRHPRCPAAVQRQDGATRHSGSESAWAKGLVKELEKAHQSVMAREDQIRQKRVERSQKSAHCMQYEKGDRVFIKIPKKPGQPGKLQTRWDGPFIVICCREGNTYRVKREDNFRKRYIRHHDQMKPFQPREGRLQGEWTAECDGKGSVDTSLTPRGPDRDKRTTPPQQDANDAGSDSETDAQDNAEEEEEEEEPEGADRVRRENPSRAEEPPPVLSRPVPLSEIPSRAEEPPPVLSRPVRERRPPDRFGEYTQ